MENTGIVLENVRLSYVHLMQPYARDPKAEKKYQVTVLVPKTDTAAKAKIDQAIAAGYTKRLGREMERGCAAAGADSSMGRRRLDAKRQRIRPGMQRPLGIHCLQPGNEARRSRRTGQIPDSGGDADLQRHLRQHLRQFLPVQLPGQERYWLWLGPVQKIADGEPLGGSAPSAKSVFKAVQAQPTPTAGGVNPLTGQPM